jgi:hypothetical protein
LDHLADVSFMLSPGAWQVELELEKALIEGTHLGHNVDTVTRQLRAPKAGHASHWEIMA